MTLQRIRSVSKMQAQALACRRAGQTLGLVPTMGTLHEGHLSLVREARAQNERVVVSIFVNPTQFCPGEDYERYPRDEARDLSLLRALEVDWVFCPPVEGMYPPGFSTYVEPPEVSRGWCGASRPGHFRGVCTVVTILLNILQPSRMYLGQKDAQQAAVLRRLVQDLHFPTDVLVCPIVREADGLAMSSRNAYLTPEERKHARVLIQTLQRGVERFEQGERRAAEILAEGKTLLAGNKRVQLDYLGIVEQNTFKSVETVASGHLYLGAMYVGKTRLIDNVIFPAGR